MSVTHDFLSEDKMYFTVNNSMGEVIDLFTTRMLATEMACKEPNNVSINQFRYHEKRDNDWIDSSQIYHKSTGGKWA